MCHRQAHYQQLERQRRVITTHPRTAVHLNAATFELVLAFDHI